MWGKWMSLMGRTVADGTLGNANPSRIKKGSWFGSREKAFWREAQVYLIQLV